MSSTKIFLVYQIGLAPFHLSIRISANIKYSPRAPIKLRILAFRSLPFFQYYILVCVDTLRGPLRNRKLCNLETRSLLTYLKPNQHNTKQLNLVRRELSQILFFSQTNITRKFLMNNIIHLIPLMFNHK